MRDEKNLVARRTAEQMVGGYDSAMGKVRQAYALLQEAQAELNLTFSAEYGFDVIDKYAHFSKLEDALASVDVKIRRRAWRAIVERLDIRRFLSVKRAEELDKQLNDERGPEPPPINIATVMDMAQVLLGNVNEMAKESVAEVFEFLRPARWESGQKYVTNKKNGRYSIGKKVIISNGVDTWRYSNGRYTINHYRRDKLVAVDRVFHMLDGKSFNDNAYVSELVDAIQTAEYGAGETPYFKFKAYQNGNLHLEFKRPDLVTQINKIGGNGVELAGGAQWPA